MSKNLIAYFSHTGENYFGGQYKFIEVGNTEVVAKKIQNMIGGTLFYIETEKAYPNTYKEVVSISVEEKKTNSRPQLKNNLASLEAYDVIYLGYPNWCGTMPMAVWTFLESHDFTNKIICPFCTNEGSGMGMSEKDIQALCPNAHLQKGLAIRGSKVYESDELIEKWLQ